MLVFVYTTKNFMFKVQGDENAVQDGDDTRNNDATVATIEDNHVDDDDKTDEKKTSKNDIGGPLESSNNETDACCAPKESTITDSEIMTVTSKTADATIVVEAAPAATADSNETEAVHQSSKPHSIELNEQETSHETKLNQPQLPVTPEQSPSPTEAPSKPAPPPRPPPPAAYHRHHHHHHQPTPRPTQSGPSGNSITSLFTKIIGKLEITLCFPGL